MGDRLTNFQAGTVAEAESVFCVLTGYGQRAGASVLKWQ